MRVANKQQTTLVRNPIAHERREGRGDDEDVVLGACVVDDTALGTFASDAHTQVQG